MAYITQTFTATKGVGASQVTFTWTKSVQAISADMCENDKVGLFMANTALRYMDKYVPMDTGMLYTNVTVEPFSVTYNSPYAARMFYGDGMNFSKERHPLAQAHWDKPTAQAYGRSIAKEVEEYIRRR